MLQCLQMTLALLARSEKDLQLNLGILTKELQRKDMIIGINKTITVVISRFSPLQKNHWISCQERLLEQVQHFMHLRSSFSDNKKISAEIRQRVENAGNIYHTININKFMCKIQIPKETKTIVFKTIYVPVRTYGCESQALNISHIRNWCQR